MATSYTYQCALFIFRRDLRVQDNTAFHAASKKSHRVIPCFIFDPRQVGTDNTYKSTNAIQFMVESLKELDKELRTYKGKLYLFTGIAEEVVAQLLQKNIIDAVFCNHDYTPFSLKRDEAIFKNCLRASTAFEQYDDALLNAPNDITTKNGDPYQVFTPFWKYCRTIPVPKVRRIRSISNLYRKQVPNSKPASLLSRSMPAQNKQLPTHGGRNNALALLKNVKTFKDYEKTHDFPAIATTHLSAALKFGVLSIREVYHTITKQLGNNHPLLRQLYWRDFFTHIAYHSPYVFGHAYKQKYDTLTWSKSKKKFDAWCNGLTGFPIIDAGMRQLNRTGFMHNRVRLLTASFLIKDLHIDWRWGEQYFAQHLVDYDPAVNNGNWQWVASTGCDAAPYFRIFNPWLQQKKYDPDCIYIKQWVPELEDVAVKTIHTWNTQYKKTISGYPRPIVDHKVEVAKAKEMYRNV